MFIEKKNVNLYRSFSLCSLMPRQKTHTIINYKNRATAMSCLRALFCLIFPPLAVLDKGCGTIIIVTALTICGWIPGVIGAILFCRNTNN